MLAQGTKLMVDRYNLEANLHANVLIWTRAVPEGVINPPPHRYNSTAYLQHKRARVMKSIAGNVSEAGWGRWCQEFTYYDSAASYTSECGDEQTLRVDTSVPQYREWRLDQVRNSQLSDSVRSVIIQHLQNDGDFTEEEIASMPDKTLKGYAPLSDEVRTKIVQHLRDDPNFNDKQIDEMSDSTLRFYSMTASLLEQGQAALANKPDKTISYLVTTINDSAQKHVESGGRVKGFAPLSHEARTEAESRRAQAESERTEAAFEARMAASLSRTAPQSANTDAAVAIAPQFTWVGKRVRGISGARNFCQGVVESVTKDGKLKIKFDGDEKVSNAMKPHTVIVLA